MCLVHDPRATSPYERTFTVEYLGNVVGGPPVKYLNVEMDLLKQLAQEQIVAGEPVWFGCDVGPQMSMDLGIWDAALYDYASVYDHEFGLSKPDRLVYRASQMTHAMLFTGVDVVDGAARRWRVENSWGDEKGIKGYWTMNDSWFDEYVFEIAVPEAPAPAGARRAPRRRTDRAARLGPHGKPRLSVDLGRVRRIDVGGASLAVREWGDEAGRPLVFVHSLGPSSSAAFLGLAAEPLVQAGFHLVAMDLPGFGESPEVPADAYDVGRLAELVWAVADAYGIDRTVIMGHSWGGAIGCLATALHPDRVEALVLVDSGHLDWGDSDPEMLAQPLDEMIRRSEGFRLRAPDLAAIAAELEVAEDDRSRRRRSRSGSPTTATAD